MFNSLSPLFRLGLISAITVIALAGTGIYASQMLELWRSRQELQAKVAEINGADGLLKQQADQLAALGGDIRRLQSRQPTISAQNQFSRYLTRAAAVAQVRLYSLPTETLSQVGEYRVAENAVSFEGTYKNILSLLHTLETEDKAGYVHALTFRKHTIDEGETTRVVLIADVVIRRLLSNEKLP